MKIFWSPLAADRVEYVFEYILKEDKVAAQKIIADCILTTCPGYSG